MNQLEAIRTFLGVVRSGSIASAATKLNVSSTMLSRHVKVLETQLGTRLFSRSTRSVSLTEVGQLYFERMSKLIDDLDDCERSLASLAHQPVGKLRIVAPAFFSWRHLAAWLHQYNRQFPQVRIALDLVDQPFDLINDGYDVALVDTATLSSTSVIARQLWDEPLIACASPEYLARCGTPARPGELVNHEYIAMAARHAATGDVQLEGPEGRFRLEQKPAMLVNNIDALMQMIRAGVGIGFVPMAIAREDIAEGVLNVVLPAYATPPVSISVVYPSREHLPAKVRTFIDHLVASAHGLRESIRAESVEDVATIRSVATAAHFPTEQRVRTPRAGANGKYQAQFQAQTA
ncbi:LysR family transcriptional regulator [Burkholderia sp. Ax-1719]|uniref:LysR substrate-binding domain-containing protein n=1 Tax=Burkholderia sp. Ax-1719 TaxID=2608334 RepID=UPI00141DC8AD|nr:LysR family transcriptional regulator [Burkholderia sp. Ax-1719]